MNTTNTRIVCVKKFVDTECSEMIPKTAALITLILLLGHCSLAQVAGDSTRLFYDDLLNNLVGKWDVSATVHGQKFTLDREAEWVMSHQYLRICEKSREVIPWLKVPFERTIFIGYNHDSKRYIVYELTVHGGDVLHQPEGFYYGDRMGNELKMVLTKGPQMVAIMRFIWEPATSSWRFQGRRVIDGKEQEPNVDQKAVRTKTSSK